MNDAVSKYVAKKVMDDIRGKKIIDDNLCIILSMHKPVGELRNLVTQIDIPLLIDIAKTGSVAYGNLAISMMGKYAKTDPNICNLLEHLWTNECSKNYNRNHVVMLTLINNEEMANKYRRDFLNFIEENFEYFKARCISYCGGKQNAYTFMSGRLKDKVYDGYKDWIYICGALCSDDTSLVRTLLLTNIENTTDDFTKDVANRMLARIM